MRPHGRAEISATKPRALGICQRCGFLYNHDRLQWQFQYGAMRLINLRILVCDTCLDTPQIQLRTVLLPPDPVPIEYPTPENYPNADNPQSPVGYSRVGQTFGMNFGNMQNDGGLDAAFDGVLHKPARLSASKSVSAVGLNNFIGKNWNANVSGPNVPPPLATNNTVSYQISSFSVYGPTDAPIMLPSVSLGGVFDPGPFDIGVFDTVQTGITFTPFLQLQGSNNQVGWATLYNTPIAGTLNEVITSVSSSLVGGNFKFHQVVVQGDGIQTARISQIQMSVSDTGQNEW